MARLLKMPLLVILIGIGAVTMYLPASHAFMLGNYPVARAFFYSATVLLVLAAMLAIATAGRRTRNMARSQLASLLGAYLVMPVVMALPFQQAVQDTSFLNAWFEMLSCFTTTGATLYETPGRLAPSLHLWRAMVGWLGGYFVLVMAVAVLAPLNLGGAEVISGRPPGRAATGAGEISHIADPAERLARHALALLPAYAGLTLVLWVALLTAGEPGLVALSHAMSTLSTSGITPGQGLQTSGLLGEMLIFLFLCLAISRRTLPGAGLVNSTGPFRSDPEVWMATVIVLIVTFLLVLRSWIGAIVVEDAANVPSLLRVIWGTLFTTLSFLTTTGFVSQDWTATRLWSGLETPGLVLLALTILGGGAATTAGGVKLLRVYALFRHGERELERIIHPTSIGGAGEAARRMRREGAYVAWIFFMLFAMSIALINGALGLIGIPFETGMVLTLSALTTTGPLAGLATETPVSFAELGTLAKLILAFAMVLGRLETLALLAFFAPDGWRRQTGKS
ncbi:potassium transporter TrkG [Paracoccaceae bacterium Fryx2]|nr:potassium transporter TrkG [Paracoccaceae bacterium Fryx2]